MKLAVFVLALAMPLAVTAGPESADDWTSYGGDAGGTHYSTLRQITRANVARLKEVWRYETPDPGAIQTTPLIIAGTMYVVSARQKVTALDAATGKARWTFDPGVTSNGISRGLTWWSDGKEQRLFTSAGSYLHAIDPATGKTIASFGDGGRIDLRANLRGAPEDNGFAATSPAVIYKDLLILGGRVAEQTPSSPGDERAYDVRTGQLRWTFHTVPRAGEPGAETWPSGADQTQGGANAWAGSIVDTERGIVFIATGSPADDFYGVNRAGDNLYSDCVIALDATTGRKLWHFQAIHHDLWDSDFAAPPVLLTVNHAGKRIAAVAATNKPGYIYLFDRVTGKPLFPIVEQKVPASSVPGEHASVTQPIPSLPAPLARHTLSRDEVTNRSPEMRAWAQGEYDTFLGTQQHFTPLSVDRTTMIAPGWEGGAEWGGMTSDPDNGVLYVNVNNVVSLGSLVDSAAFAMSGQGERTYQAQCMACHGLARQGLPPGIPSLVDVGTRLSAEAMHEVIVNGRGRMPGFTSLNAATRTNLISFLRTGKDELAARPAASRGTGLRYVFTGYRYFTDPQGYPAGPTPWGTLNAVDMNTGKYLWTVPFGEHTELAAQGLTDTGSESHGGTVLTASGLLFAGGSEHDTKFRAFDTRNGRMLWQAQLPGHGAATPATYAVKGRQFVVIAAGPRRPSVSATTAPAPGLEIAKAGTYVVFTLP